MGAGSSPKRLAPTSAMSFVALLYVPSWKMRRWPRVPVRSRAGRSRLAIVGRCEGAHVVIEVPGELRRGAEAKVEDGVDVAGEDLGFTPFWPGP